MLTLIPSDLQLLTVDETCAILSISRATLYRRFAAGEIERTGDGALVRVPLASIRAYQQRHMRGGSNATRTKAAG